MTTTDPAETTAERFGLKPRRSLGLAGLARKTPAGRDRAQLTLEELPDPSIPAGSGTELTEDERKDFEICEGVVRTAHHESFWLTGKALDAVAARRLYRAEFATFEGLLEAWDVSLADSSRMRRGWRLAARLLPDVPKLTRSHVEALLPVIDRYGLDAAVTLYGVLRETSPKVTAKIISEVVGALPGPESSGDPSEQIREQAGEALTRPGPHAVESGPSRSGGPDEAVLRQAVDRRARQLADELSRGRFQRGEVNRALAEAFADPEDTRVYRALRRWMKDREGRR
ncbi:hypothetical protein [Streptomyces sp. WMMC905]|uniref:hypothetical protein n=1 Tax=Streptomyces sp. WMMC905 TaxID=3404123 RepID=UPI003B95FD80